MSAVSLHRQKGQGAFGACSHRPCSAPIWPPSNDWPTNSRLRFNHPKGFGLCHRSGDGPVHLRAEHTAAISIALDPSLPLRDTRATMGGALGAQLKTPVIYHRKLWEFAMSCRRIQQHGLLVPGTRALGFGCGWNPCPAILPPGPVRHRHDLKLRSEEKGLGTQQSASGSPGKRPTSPILSPPDFDCAGDARVVDMNHIPDGICAL